MLAPSGSTEQTKCTRSPSPNLYSQPGAPGPTVGSSHCSGVGVRSSSECASGLRTNGLHHAANHAECEIDTQTSNLQSLPPSRRDHSTFFGCRSDHHRCRDSSQARGAGDLGCWVACWIPAAEPRASLRLLTPARMHTSQRSGCVTSVPLLCFLQSADLEKACSLEPGSRGHEVHRGVAGLSGAQALGLAKTPKELRERSFPKTPKRPRHQVRARARLARPRPQPCEAQLPLLVSAGAKLRRIKREDRPLQPHPKMHLEALAYVVTNTVLLLCGLLALDVVQIPEARNFSVNLNMHRCQ